MTVEAVVRPTKKQQELLIYIEKFIAEHGYSPSYREIMSGLQYNSVATVALHVNSLIRRGHLRKRDRSARSIEVVTSTNQPVGSDIPVRQLKATEEKWLVQKVELFFKEVEGAPKLIERELDQLYVLVGALKVLGLDGAASTYVARLSEIKKRSQNSKYAA